jgi:hypothetical protein
VGLLSIYLIVSVVLVLVKLIYLFSWQIARRLYVNKEDIKDELLALSCEPNLRVRTFSACLVNGVRFHTVDREKNRRTQNSGILANGEHDNEDVDFYGCLKEIIELSYNSDFNDNRTVVLFRCDWFDTHGKKFRMKDDGIFRSINHGSFWYKNDPFILATMAKKVFYLEDTKYHEKWRVVQKFSHRHLWNVAENDKDDIPEVVSLSYQDEECEGGFQVAFTEGTIQNEQPVNGDFHTVDATIVDDLRRQREEEIEQNESSDEDDETRWQYVSDNEFPTNPPEDDDDSDHSE